MTPDRPLVSTIIPCFNTGRFLGEAIGSALSQEGVSQEVIVVDDGSTDDSKAVAESFLSDSRVHYIHQTNMGLSAARNTGVRAARGKYIKFLDADDLILPGGLESQVEFLEKNAAVGVVVGAHHWVDEQGNHLATIHLPLGRISAEEVLVRNWPIHAGLYRSAWVRKTGGFDTQLRAAEDWEFHARLFLAGCHFERTSPVVVSYRQVATSMSKNHSNQLANRLLALEIIYSSKECMEKHGRLKARALTHTYEQALIGALGRGDKELVKCCVDSLLASPTSVPKTKVRRDLVHLLALHESKTEPYDEMSRNVRESLAQTPLEAHVTTRSLEFMREKHRVTQGRATGMKGQFLLAVRTLWVLIRFPKEGLQYVRELASERVQYALRGNR